MSRFGDRYMNEENWRIVEALKAFCEARGHTLLDLAFSWLLSHDCLASVIAGATRPEQIEQNVKAAEWKLTPAGTRRGRPLSAKGVSYSAGRVRGAAAACAPNAVPRWSR